MGKPCQYVFRYNGDKNSEEVVLDMDGAMSLPAKGQIIQRKERPWKVVAVSTQLGIAPHPPLPVHTVALTDDLKAPI